MPYPRKESKYFKDLRTQLVAYEALMNEIRVRLEYASKHTSNDARLSIRLREFVDGFIVIKQGNILSEALSIIGDEEFSSQVKERFLHIGDISARYLIATRYSSDVIVTFVDILEAYDKYKDSLHVDEFVCVFGDDSQVVQDCLQVYESGFNRLSDDLVRSRIFTLMVDDSFDPSVEKIIDDIQNELKILAIKLQEAVDRLKGSRNLTSNEVADLLGVSRSTLGDYLSARNKIRPEKIIQLTKHAQKKFYSLNAQNKAPLENFSDYQALIKQIKPLYESRNELLIALDVKSSTFTDMQHGRVSQKRLDSVIAQARELIAHNAVCNESSEVPVVVEEVVTREASETSSEVQSATSPLPISIQELGETTRDGVRYVLTEKSFRSLVDPPLLKFMDSLMASIENTQLFLGVVAQLSDPQSRELITKDKRVSSALRELKTVFDLLRSSDPSNRLGLHDASRDFQLQQGKGDQ